MTGVKSQAVYTNDPESEVSKSGGTQHRIKEISMKV